ncbi:ADP-ribosylglycohydrolase family protein [Streptomyces sp. enrichment culture]|uniref:ADP-ribosylglycohydrolase family protein n=1 Tax=Streptomyces sp. enrichment culture TaxID=1795815 RepID=UPI003F55A1A0
MASTACIPPVPAPQDAVGLRDRARGALLGLAVGDALGAPAENMKPSEIRARWGRITGYVADRPAGTDDTEYAIFSGLLLARHGAGLTQAHVEAAWHEWIADREEGPFRGAGFSERGTLENLRRGLAAPISAQHRHAWSDGLAMRAAPHGVFAAGRPAEAARLAAIDGSVSHEGEGIYGGQAVAAGVAAAMAGASTVAVVASALAVVPDDSWTARCLRRALTAAHRGERAVRSAVVIGGYPWTDLAPEAVALAFGAYAAADGDFTDSVLTAVNMGRDADTTAAVAGALAGATRGVRAIPPDWADAIGPARGSCLPSMAGHHVLEVADLLTRTAHEAPPDPGHARAPEAGPPASHTHTTGQATRPPDKPPHPHPTPDKASDTAPAPLRPAPGVHATTQTTSPPDKPPHPTPDKAPDTAPTPLRSAPATTQPAPGTPTTTQTTPPPDKPPHPTPDKAPDTAPTPLRSAPATTQPAPGTPTTTQTTPPPDSPPRPDPAPTPRGAPAPSASGAVPLAADPHGTARATPAPDPRAEPGETPHTAPAPPPPAPGTGHPAPGTRAAAAVGP